MSDTAPLDLGIVHPQDAAETAGLVYVRDDEAGLRRRKAGSGFTYITAAGVKVRDHATVRRIRKLAIPPAWTNVWICRMANGHIQATGRDARGRKQYRYHDAFREIRESTKYDHMMEFANALSSIRAKIAQHMA